jgi:hypothetical protein
MSKKWMLLAVTMVVLASLACGIGGGGTTAPTEEGEPTPAGQATEAPVATSGEEGMPAISPDALSGLNSYRFRLVWQWQTDAGEAQEMRMEGEETRDPSAQHYIIQTADGTMEWIRIGDTQWTNFGSGWMQSQQEPEETFGDLLGTDNFSDITSSSQSQFVGGETVNGLRTQHYRLELSPAEIAAIAQGEVTDVHSEVWIADESGLPAFVVRYQMGWTGNVPSGEGQTGTVEWTYDIYDVNAPITITAPENAGGLPEDIPAYTGPTSDFFSMEGLISFSTTDDVATVADFYRQELAAQGWTLSSDEDLSGTIMQSWEKAGRQLQVMINTQDGTTSVMLSITTP